MILRNLFHKVQKLEKLMN